MKITCLIKKFIICFITAAVVLCSSSCRENSAENTLKNYFSSLNNLDFLSAGELSGEEEFYKKAFDIFETSDDTDKYEKLQSMYFVEFIYSNISCEIISEAIIDDENIFHCIIKAYDATEVIEKVGIDAFELMQTEEYINASDSEKYDMLCERLSASYEEMKECIEKKESEIDISVIKKDKKYFVVPSAVLFNALGGNINK